MGMGSVQKKKARGYRRSETGKSVAPPSLSYQDEFIRDQIRHNKIQDFRTVMVYSLLGLIAAGTVVFALGHFLKKQKKNKVQQGAMEEGNPATYATLFKMAFDNDNMLGWGTNEELVFQTARQVPSKKFYDKVQSAYSTLYQSQLNADLKSELSSDEYVQVMQIINAKQ
jgi:hypothetical protein